MSKDHLNLFRYKMKSTISILLFFALPFVIYGGNTDQYLIDATIVENLAQREINGELLLKEDGFLGLNSNGFFYEGKIKEDNRTVAIKFFHDEYMGYYEREMAAYSYLKAFKNESVEKYGIPAVYYYGRWQHYILVALTKLDFNLEQLAELVGTFDDNPLDILILLRDFVYQSKYIHSHGIRYNSISPVNIMLRGHRSFLIDFKDSSKMMEDFRPGTAEFDCNRYLTGELRRPIDDYESFIYVIMSLMGKDWIKPWRQDNGIRKNKLSDKGLEGVIKAFADEIFTDDESKSFPDYDNLENIVSAEIRNLQPRLNPNRPPKFSWITTDAEPSPARKITDIRDPKSINFTALVYPAIVPLA